MSTSSESWKVQAFQYPSAGTALPAMVVSDPAVLSSPDYVQSESTAMAEATAQETAYRAAKEELQKQHEDSLGSERERINQSVAEFHEQRRVYFQRVEAEVVGLALTIARNILHREAQIDPLLLLGMVRVVLERLDANTQVKLRIHPSLIGEWRKHCAGAKGSAAAPALIEDSEIDPGECIMETSMGRTTIGVDSHLSNIEQGLFELLACRPGAEHNL